MLFPKKVKHRKWHTGRKDMQKAKPDTRGTVLSYGSFGLKAETAGRIRSNQLEAARKAMARQMTKTGKAWIRIFPDRPYTAKPAEVGMGKGKGDPQGFCAEIRPGRVIFEIDGLDEKIAREALRKAGTKLPVKTRVVARA
jgi:large subunit ribosomal protein L16